MFSVNTNLSAMSAMYQMARFQQQVDTSMERLATGKKINKASDDPAGAVAEASLSDEIVKTKKLMDQDVFEEKRVGAVEGAQGVMEDLIQELNSLVPQSANRGAQSPEELAADQQQVDSILDTLDHLAQTTRFEGDLVVSSMTAGGLGLEELRTGGKLNLVDGDAEKAQKAVQGAIDQLSTSRAGAGLRAKQLQGELDAMETKYESLSAARSQVADTDYASETANYVRASMLRDAAQYVTSLSLKQNSDMVMMLLKPLGVVAALGSSN